MARVKFLEDYQVQTNNGRVFKTGDVVEIADTTAYRYLHKGLVEVMGDDTEKPVPPPKNNNQPTKPNNQQSQAPKPADNTLTEPNE